MDSQQLKNLEDVYKKWEEKSSSGQYGTSRDTRDSFRSCNGGPTPGREAWIREFGDRPRPIPNRQPTRRRKRQKDDFEIFHSTSEKQYEVSPVAIPSIYKRDRPFMGRSCPRCLDNSREAFYKSEVINKGMHNILNINVYSKENLFRRTFCHIIFIWNRNVSGCFSKVSKSVTNSPRVQNCILNTVFQESLTSVTHGSTAERIEDLDKTRQKKVTIMNQEANGIVSNMAAQIYRKLVKLAGWFLFKLFSRLLDGIQIHKGQVQMLQVAAQENKPMVFLPLHKSHLDYVLVTWVLLTCDIQPPHVAAGDNLNNMLLFSWLMRHLGGFFIKRKLDHESGKDDLYKSVLQEYVQQLLKEKQNLEIFIEGSRSRTGKAMVPKSGLLSVVVNSVLEGLVPDVLIVPVNISYEKVFETSYQGELLGQPKKPETFCEAVKGIWQVLGTRYGQLRVDFAQPFSLQEFSRSMDCSPIMQEFSSNMAAKSSLTSTPVSSLLKNVSDLSLADMGDDKCFLLTKALGYHVIHGAVQCSAVMSTNILAFLLLHIHREGTSIKELTASFDWLRGEVFSRGRDVGFSGKTEDVVGHALELLSDLVDSTHSTVNDDVMTSRCDDGDQPITADAALTIRSDIETTNLRPKLQIPYIIDLVHYSNLVLSIFALESVVACSVIAVAKDNGIQATDIEQEGTLPHNEVLDKARQLCEILQREFIFLPPCKALDVGVNEAMEKFLSSEMIRSADQSRGTTGSNRREWAQSFAVNAWDEEDDDGIYLRDAPEPQYKLSSSKSELVKLKFLQSLMSPLIESYWVASCGLLWLRGQQFTEGEFLAALHHCAKERVSEDLTMFPESCSLEPLRNALRVFKEMNVVEVRETADLQNVLRLTEQYNSDEAVFELIENIHQFKT